MLKEKIMTAPILAYSHNDHQFCLECNASNYTIEAVLSILKEDKWYPIANKEMFSIIRALGLFQSPCSSTLVVDDLVNFVFLLCFDKFQWGLWEVGAVFQSIPVR